MDLSPLGLTENETKAYEALLLTGKTSASTVSRESGVSYGKIYEVLGSLERKGLVRVIPEKTKQFAPAGPDALLAALDARSAALESLRARVTDLKHLYDAHNEEPVLVAQGKRNFYELIKQLKPSVSLSYAIKYSGEYQPEWERKIRAAVKRGVDRKVLFNVTESTHDNVVRWIGIEPEMRSFANDGVAIDIGETEVLIALIKQNTTVLVRDPAFATIMQRLFTSAYAAAPPIQKT